MSLGKPLSTVHIERQDWPASGSPTLLDPTYEQYAYNVFGGRVGVMHCAAIAPEFCKGMVRVYDYVDGQLQVERESDNAEGVEERFISVYTWGPTGLIARRG